MSKDAELLENLVFIHGNSVSVFDEFIRFMKKVPDAQIVQNVLDTLRKQFTEKCEKIYRADLKYAECQAEVKKYRDTVYKIEKALTGTFHISEQLRQPTKSEDSCDTAQQEQGPNHNQGAGRDDQRSAELRDVVIDYVRERLSPELRAVAESYCIENFHKKN